MKVTDGKRTFDVTEKAYKVIYASLGYEPVSSLDDLTVPELKELAKEKEIEGYSDMKKRELIKALS